MRKISVLTLFVCLCGLTLSAQVNINAPWTWVSGDNHIPSRPSAGTKGVAATGNTLGARKEATVWHDDANGITWLFGGYGFGGNGQGYLNDLWKYDHATNQWTWVHGDNDVEQLAVYGMQGVSATTNKPGARRGAVGQLDTQGNLWLFGGEGYNASSSGALNDLWKYDPSINEWTWYAGTNALNDPGNPGTLGVTAPTNWPSGRHGASIWEDPAGLIWIFGGHQGSTAFNDLWKYDPVIEQWTRMSITGPGARTSKMTWTDNAGNLYLFGGISGGSFVTNPAAAGSGPSINHGNRFNDMWKYIKASNSWVLLKSATTNPVWGTKGVFDPANTPGRKADAVAWKDAAGNFYLLGGSMATSTNATEFYNDLWKYDVTTDQWAWVGGTSANGSSGEPGTQGVSDPNNVPPGLKGATAWTDAAGKFWLVGGQSSKEFLTTYRNTVWKYDPLINEFTWMKGDNFWLANPIGTKGVTDPSNKPGERRFSSTWYDNNGNLWLYGGNFTQQISGATDANIYSDLWKYNISSDVWTWMHGTYPAVTPRYGTVGVADPLNTPGARFSALSWIDNSNNLWLMGGRNPTAISDALWKYDMSLNQWAVIKGVASHSNVNPVYGTQGVASSTNTPGSRISSSTWTDNNGDFWLFGSSTLRNDLWKFNIASSQWTWMHGNNAGGAAVYGTKGVAAAANTPGGRENCVSWVDNTGNFWLFGGDLGGSITLNELWKYDITTNQWTWMHGDNTTNGAGVYGTKGTAAAANKPGARGQAVGWTDGNGNLWLFGGRGYDASGSYGELNDMWMYNKITNEWTWVKGDATVGVNGIYGTKGVANVNNKPGTRYGALAWKDALNNFWLYGGWGYGESGISIMSDLWRIASPVLSPLPVHLLEFKGQLVNNNGVLNWKTENEDNAASYTIERSTDRRSYVPVGTVTANNTAGKHQYSFTDPGIASLGAQVIYYKLKQSDFDGKGTYSNIIALTLDKSSFVLFYPNPVIRSASVTVTLERAEQVQVRVISSTGTVVKQLQWKLPAGSTIEEIDLDALPAGQYYLDLSGETLSKRIGFVKQ